MIQILEARGKIFSNFRIGEAFLSKLYRKTLIDVASETMKNIRHNIEVKIFKIMDKNMSSIFNNEISEHRKALPVNNKK